jgi:adenine/guanine phosphoribosyltransferase-like PRPP-binding protein
MYTKEKILKLAKRYNNAKRSYLLVNPIQAKHIPTAPHEALGMMNALGDKLAALYPTARLVIGFAETATAIATAVASRIDGCHYVQTTRENFSNVSDWIVFLEEHSHATEQKISASAISTALKDTDTVIFVDDEISTGKTLVNIITQISGVIPNLKSKRIVAASIINRVSDENEKMLEAAGVESAYLLKIDNEDYEKEMAGISVDAPHDVPAISALPTCRIIDPKSPLPDPRVGVGISLYTDAINAFVDEVMADLGGMIADGSRLLVLGTEECMYPALVLASRISDGINGVEVFCHATTRSPIGLYGDSTYPIKNGYRIHSFYDQDRINYIYNADGYDTVILVTDSPYADGDALDDVVSVFSNRGSRNFVKIGGRTDV